MKSYSGTRTTIRTKTELFWSARDGTALAPGLSRIRVFAAKVKENLSSVIHFGSRRQTWQLAVCIGVLAYLTLGVMTNSLRGYHWLMLGAIPAALLSAERGKRFFLDWSSLFAFWLVYDRLRLVQPLLYARVAVEHPFLIERSAFGWLAEGAVPAHAAHSWLTVHAGCFALAAEWTAQVRERHGERDPAIN